MSRLTGRIALRRPPLSALAAALAVLAAIIAAPAASADSYTVRDGDSLSVIAVRFGVEVDDIVSANNAIESADAIIRIGQIIEVPSVRAGTGGASYTVRAGDTLEGIADRIGSTAERLRELNPGINPRSLQIGQQIVIDGAAANTAAATPAAAAPQVRAEAVEYIVRSGDTGSAIADRFSATLDELRSWNPNVDLDSIHPGDSIFIRSGTGASAAGSGGANVIVRGLYTVRSGDTLSHIAVEFDTDLATLLDLNPGLRAETIQPGQEVVVPWSGASSAPAAGSTTSGDARRHVVATGDTISGIAERYQVTVLQLRQLNPELVNDLIVPGQTIVIGAPARTSSGTGTGSTSSTTASDGAATTAATIAPRKVVAKADHVQYAAAALGTLPETLLANNPGIGRDDWIAAGTSLIVPPQPGRLVIVRDGDTLYALAERYGVEIYDFFNEAGRPAFNDDVLHTGDQLLIKTPMPDFSWPTLEGEISDGFGVCRTWDCSWRHRGTDVAADPGTALYAPADGLVTFAGGNPGTGLGYYVRIQHDHGFSSIVAHLHSWNVRLGQQVRRGDLIGALGNTGNSTGPHMHLEIRQGDWYIDPTILLPRRD